jgi:hypothetical protein
MGHSTHQGDIKMRANGFEQVGKAPRNVMLLVLGCSSCMLAVAGMLATGTEMLGVVSSVGLGMIIVVTRLARRMRNAWQQQRQKNAAVPPRDVDRSLLPVERLPHGVSANRSQNAA